MSVPKVTRLLAPVDFSEITPEVISYAVHFSRLLSAELYLLHVVHVPALAEASTWLDPVVSPTLEQDLRRQVIAAAEARLKELGQELSAQGVKVEVFLREGVPHAEVVKAASEIKADLIIMGSQGHSAISRLLLGSVAERVVRRAPCHVLCIKPQLPEKA